MSFFFQKIEHHIVYFIFLSFEQEAFLMDDASTTTTYIKLIFLKVFTYKTKYR
jgi:hypothetical protein